MSLLVCPINVHFLPGTTASAFMMSEWTCTLNFFAVDAIEIKDTVTVTAFGVPVPLLKSRWVGVH